MSIAHGTIMGGLSTVPDLSDALSGYRDCLGLELVEQGALAADLAASWNCPGNAGSPYAVLRPKSGAPCWFRLVEQPDHPGFKPTRSYGWAAFECTVEDVWHWPDVVEGAGFTIVGPPKKLENIEPAFIPMQVLGTGREMVYLNQVLNDMPGTDLPRAKSAVDRIFIVVLATPDRDASVEWYRDRLGLTRGADYSLPYSMINNAFGLPADTLTTITMVQHDRMPIVEVDDYPAAATDRPCHHEQLPPGNALVSLAVRDVDQCDVDWIMPPDARQGALYEERRCGTTIGAGGELVELVEVGE
ncbi:VOC family protein [uncultured Erythrobacter sp.]|uniref:VOC family protein n=1 Tax=uncultured Erythrobacter sp. TaxID=263913 RepID=UPI00263571BF|nr:VOC family protein [uncultured Erythrobacter sp.]